MEEAFTRSGLCLVEADGAEHCVTMSRKCIGSLEHCTGELENRLKVLLPAMNHGHVHLCSIERTESNDGFVAVFRLAYREKEEIQNFMLRFSEISRVTWRVLKKQRDMCAGRRNNFWARYHCQRGNNRLLFKTKKHHQKHTDCTAALTVTLKKVGKRCRSKDSHLPEFPTIIVLRHQHNHPLVDANFRQRMEIPEELKSKFLELFRCGHSPSTALDVHRFDMQMEHGEGYFELTENRTICPDIQFCYRYFVSTYQKKYQEPNEMQLYQLLEQKVSELESTHSGIMVRLKKAADHCPVVVICTPLMIRAHRLMPLSAKIVFLESSGCLDKSKNHTYILMTHSNVGSMPLGVIITSSESRMALDAGLQELKDMLGNDAFYFKGAEGPAVIVTDDNMIQQAAVSALYPSATVLVSVRSILTSVWRWMLDSKNGMAVEDRALAVALVRDIVFCYTDSDLNESYTRARNASVNHTSFLDKLTDIWNKRFKWSPALSISIPLRGLVTNNIAEASVRSAKDKVWYRLRAYSIIQLLDFVVTRHDKIYENRIIDYLSNRLSAAAKAKFLPVFERPLSAQARAGTSVTVTPLYQDAFDVTETTISSETNHCTQTITSNRPTTTNVQCQPNEQNNYQYVIHQPIPEQTLHQMNQIQSSQQMSVFDSLQSQLTEIPQINNVSGVVKSDCNMIDLTSIIMPLIAPSVPVMPQSVRTKHHVNMTIGSCTCALGSCGASCKHQYAVVQKFDVTSCCFTVTCSDLSMRRVLYEVATGHPQPSEDWFSSNDVTICSLPTALNNPCIDECPSDNNADVSTEDRMHETRTKFIDFMHSMLYKFDKQPQMFEPALRSFSDGVTRLKANSDIANALKLCGQVCRRKDWQNSFHVLNNGVAANTDDTHVNNTERPRDVTADYDESACTSSIKRVRKRPRRYVDNDDNDDANDVAVLKSVKLVDDVKCSVDMDPSSERLHNC